MNENKQYKLCHESDVHNRQSHQTHEEHHKDGQLKDQKQEEILK